MSEKYFIDMVRSSKEELIEKVLNQNTVIRHLEGLRREYEEILGKVGYEVEQAIEKGEWINKIGLFVEEDILYTTLKLNEKKLAFRYPNEYLHFVIAEALEYGKSLDELLGEG